MHQSWAELNVSDSNSPSHLSEVLLCSPSLIFFLSYLLTSQEVILVCWWQLLHSGGLESFRAAGELQCEHVAGAEEGRGKDERSEPLPCDSTVLSVLLKSSCCNLSSDVSELRRLKSL